MGKDDKLDIEYSSSYTGAIECSKVKGLLKRKQYTNNKPRKKYATI